MVLGHTRWASVGIISEANAHPLNHEELDGADRPYVVGALNGDVDNYADLKALEQLQVPAEITTDAKVIPALVARRLAAGATVDDAFRTTVAELAGSMGIAAQTAAAPDELLLSLRGSGQALYVGLAEDAFVVASEPYGLVEETATYLRMDGETPADPERAAATRGQVVVLDAEHAGTLDGIRRFAFDGTPLPVSPDELQHAEITTRDIDRGDFPHFLLKEISEAPASFRKTLRGQGRRARRAALTSPWAADTLPDDAAGAAARRQHPAGRGDRPGHRRHRRTEPRRGRSRALADDELRAEAVVATEFSGFQLARRHVRHAGRRHQPERHHHRHQPHRRTWRAPAAPAVVVDRQPAQQRPGRQVRRRALHVGRARRRDGGAVHQGVLRADRGRVVARASPSPTRSRRSTRARVHELLDALRSLPDAMLRVLGQRDAIAEIAQPARRRRAATGRSSATAATASPRAGGAGQGVRALLQVDLVRRHRGQEAHRPVGRAAGDRVRGGAAGLERRRRRQGDRDLPRAPRRADRDRQRRRAPLRRRARDHPGARGAPRRRVRAVGDGRSPLRVRGRARDRRVGATAARGARRDPVRGLGQRRRPTTSSPRLRPGASRSRRRRFLDGAARRRVRRPPRSRHRGAHRVAAALRHRHRAARRVPGRARRGGHARAGWSRTSPPRSPPASRSSPGRSTRSSTRRRPSPSASRVPTRSCSRCALAREVLAAGARATR